MKLAFRAARAALVVSVLSTLAVPLAAAPAAAVAPTGTTTLVAPGEGELAGGNPTFTWTPVAGAARYRVQVSTTEVFPVTPEYSSDTVNTNATPQAALPVGPLWWRVAPMDAASALGTWTNGSFTHVWADAPVLQSPAAGDTLTYPDEPLLFQWDPLTGAKTYNIQVDNDVNFISPLKSDTTNNTSYTLTEPQTNDQEFFWRVQGVNGKAVGPWSEARSFYVEWPTVPVLTSPAAGATVTDVVLRWSPVAGAASYEVEVSPNEDFSNNVPIDVVVKGTGYSPPSTLDNGSYYWRVRARDAVGSTANLGGWSARIESSPGVYLPSRFTRAWNVAPTLLSPADQDYAVTAPTLRWTSVPHASHYELNVGYDVNFSTGTFDKCFTNQTSFTPYKRVDSYLPAPAEPAECTLFENEPAANTPIYWRVRGVDAPAGVNGLFSETFEFIFEHESIPARVSPEYDATVGVPTLEWTPVLGVSRYLVSVFDAGNPLKDSPFTTFATTYTPTGLVSGKSYTWHVQSLDTHGRQGWVPSPFARGSFTYSPPAPTATVISLVDGADGAASQLNPSMAWTPVQNAAEYRVFRRLLGAQGGTLLGDTTSAAFTSTAMPPSAGTYEWWVEAYTALGAPVAASALGTFTVQDLDVVTGLLPAKCAPDAVCPTSPETPRLSWNETPNTGGYLVHLAADASFTNILRTYRTQFPSLTPRESLLDNDADSAYYWFVQPCRFLSTGCGRFDNATHSTASAFRKRSLPVQLLSPAHDAVIPASGTDPENISFSWAEYAGTNAAATPASSQGARQYRIQVSEKADFSTIVDDKVVDQTTYTPHERTYPEGPLFWRVHAIDGSGNPLTPSADRRLVKATPPLTPQHPTAGSTVSAAPYFKWSAQPHVARYEVEVYKNADTNYASANKVTTASASTRLTAYTPKTSLPAGAYAWRVSRIDANTVSPQTSGRPGPWADGGVFTVAASAPTLTSPADGAVVKDNNLLFTWGAVPGAAQYRFDATTASFTDSKVTVMTSWAPTAKYPDGAITWRVTAMDAAQNPLATSAPLTIVKDGTAPTVKTKTPTSAAPFTAGSPFTVTFSEPVVGLSPSTFTMKVTTGGASVPGTVTPGVATAASTATFKPTVNLVPGETYTVALSSGISDVNGNALVPSSWTVRTATVVDGLSSVVSEYWDRDTSASASGGAYLASAIPNMKAVYTFTGTSASILGRRGPDGGYAAVYLDGVKVATATFYSSTVRFKQVVWSKTGLVNKAHKVELRVLGTKPSVSKSTWVYPDAFRYGATTLEETSKLVDQSFRSIALAGALNRTYQLATHTASGDTGTQPYTLLAFKGTGVAWRGIRGTAGGIARVYVDNALKATIDTYGTASSSGQVLWSISGLSNARHTVKIVVIGAKRSTSSGYNVTVDSFSLV